MQGTRFLLVLLLAAGCRTTQPVAEPPITAAPAAPTPVAEPSTAARPALAKTITSPEACKACDGQWGRYGLAQQEGCLCRTKDAGKVCKSMQDCESECVAGEVPETEIVEPGPPAKGFFLGRCHAFVPFIGCGRLLGVSDGAPVSLAEPPPKICVD
jgi:hypothetical protein